MRLHRLTPTIRPRQLLCASRPPLLRVTMHRPDGEYGDYPPANGEYASAGGGLLTERSGS